VHKGQQHVEYYKCVHCIEACFEGLNVLCTADICCSLCEVRNEFLCKIWINFGLQFLTNSFEETVFKDVYFCLVLCF
jgi:hypothetical protein